MVGGWGGGGGRVFGTLNSTASENGCCKRNEVDNTVCLRSLGLSQANGKSPGLQQKRCLGPSTERAVSSMGPHESPTYGWDFSAK